MLPTADHADIIDLYNVCCRPVPVRSGAVCRRHSISVRSSGENTAGGSHSATRRLDSSVGCFLRCVPAAAAAAAEAELDQTSN